MRYNATDKLRVFKEIPEFGCFMVDPEFKRVSDKLALPDGHTVVWIGRTFQLSNLYKQFWYENWEQREALAKKAVEIGIQVKKDDLLVVDPARLIDDTDTRLRVTDVSQFIAQFWFEVLAGLRISFGLLCDEARNRNNTVKVYDDLIVRMGGRWMDSQARTPWCDDLEQRIAALEAPS